MHDIANISVSSGMKRSTLFVVWLVHMTAFLYGQASSATQTPVAAAAPTDYALVGAKIYPSPGSAPIENGVVIVRNGKIAAVGTKDQVRIPGDLTTIDCREEVLTDGFWNCHVHFIEAKWQHAKDIPVAQFNSQMEDMLTSHGFAHVFDLASLDFPNLRALRNRINTGEVRGPVIYCVGVPFTPPNGSPFYIEPAKLPEIGDPREAELYVKQQIDSGADGIKIWSASPAHKKIIDMPVDVAKAAVAAAHRLGKPVFAHPTNNEGVEVAIAAGVDILAHVSPEDRKPWSDTTIRKMLRNHMALIPTLKLYKWDIERFSGSSVNNPLILTGQQQLFDYAKAGGQILFGTDVGYMTDYSTTDEFDGMAKAGLSFQQVLTALTTAPAQRFGQSKHTGKISVGMDADLVLLSADPALDLRSFSKVDKTICRGKFIYSRTP
jgi:imidazolonepropionase-like amidohydrolase